jgi:hypothetical protein
MITLLSGCAAIAEVAYDMKLDKDREQCDQFVSMSDRQNCRQRVNTIERQAEEKRKK